MRVALFSESLPPLTDGVARTYTWLAQALDEQGVDFRFVSPCAPTEPEPWRGRVWAQPWFSFPLYRYYRVGLPWPRKLFAQLDAFRPQLIQAAAPTPLGWLALYYARSRGLPLFTSYHTHFTDYFPYYRLGRLQNPGWNLLRLFYNAGQRTLVPSLSCLQRLRDKGFQRLALWERGLDSDRFSPRFRSATERARWASPGEALLLYVGRLVSDKDVDVLAEALEHLRAQRLAVRCVFAGDGPRRADLAKRLSLDHFPGFVHGQALARLYASADVFVFPSPNETFGNVVLEAQASGLPVVAVEAGGPSDLIQSGVNGLLVRPGDAGELALGVRRLLQGPREAARLARAGLQTAGGRHWRKVHGDLVGLYRDALGLPPEAANADRPGRAVQRAEAPAQAALAGRTLVARSRAATSTWPASRRG